MAKVIIHKKVYGEYPWTLCGSKGVANIWSDKVTCKKCLKLMKNKKK